MRMNEFVRKSDRDRVDQRVLTSLPTDERGCRKTLGSSGPQQSSMSETGSSELSVETRQQEFSIELYKDTLVPLERGRGMTKEV